jgi:hypothetical protein
MGTGLAKYKRKLVWWNYGVFAGIADKSSGRQEEISGFVGANWKAFPGNGWCRDGVWMYRILTSPRVPAQRVIYDFRVF